MFFNVTKNPKYQCDICGHESGCFEDLLPEYQTKQVKKVCTNCSGKLNNRLRDIVKVKERIGQRLMKKFIEQQRIERRHS